MAGRERLRLCAKNAKMLDKPKEIGIRGRLSNNLQEDTPFTPFSSMSNLDDHDN